MANPTSIQDIQAAITLLTTAGQTFEVRIPHADGRSNRTDSGYFNDPQKAAQAIASYDGKAPGIYMTLNPVKPDLLGRANNRMRPFAKDTTTDADILRRAWLPIDFDPVRSAGLSSNEAEHQAALAKAGECAAWLASELGWPEPVFGDSGNGAHLLYRIDLPNDEASTKLIKNDLTAVDARFSDNIVKVDTGVFNAARIWKVYGTMACKGDSIPERPHRQSALVSTPNTVQVVSLEQLQTLAALANQPETHSTEGKQSQANHEPRKRDLVDEIKSRLAIEDVACELFPGERQNEPGGQIRILGNNGLILKPSEGTWYRFNGDEIGGDVFDLIGYHKCGSEWDNHNPAMFNEALKIAADMAGVSLPKQGQRRKNVNGDPQATSVEKVKFDAPMVADLLKEQNPHLAYDADDQTWRRWTGVFWEPYRDNEAIDLLVSDILHSLGLVVSGEGQVNTVLRYAQATCKRLFRTEREGLLNFVNGTLELRSNTLRPHDKGDNLTFALPYEYRPGNCPTITRFLASVIPDEMGQAAYMTHIGLALLGDMSFHKALLLYGIPRSGKSTLLDLALLVCGHERGSYAGAALFSPETEGMRVRFSWRDQRLVALDEFPEDAIRDSGEAIFKSMTAHGGVSTRGMYKSEATDNRWRTKIIMATNDTPRIADRSGAIRERIITIRCPNKRSDAQQDKHLIEKLIAELPEFVVACIDSAHQAIAAGQYPTSDAMRDLADEIEIAGDAIKSWASEYCIFDPAAWTPSESLYISYASYCHANGQKVASKNKLTQALRDRYPQLIADQRRQAKTVRPTRGIVGIRLQNDSDFPVSG